MKVVEIICDMIQDELFKQKFKGNKRKFQTEDKILKNNKGQIIATRKEAYYGKDKINI